LIWSTLLRIWSSAKPPNLDFVNSFEDLDPREAPNFDFINSFEDMELREASESRFGKIGAMMMDRVRVLNHHQGFPLCGHGPASR